MIALSDLARKKMDIDEALSLFKNNLLSEDEVTSQLGLGNKIKKFKV